MLNNMYLEKLIKHGYIVIPASKKEGKKCNNEQLAALIQTFASLSYAFDPKAIQGLALLNEDELEDFYHTYVGILRYVSGVNYKHIVFYKNFPKLENISSLEMYVRAVLHYITRTNESMGFMNDDILDYEREVVHNEKKKVLKTINEEEGIKIIIEFSKNLFEANNAISYSEFDFLEYSMREYKDYINIENIPFKENIGHYVRFLLPRNLKAVKYKDYISLKDLKFIKNPTDLLRVYSSLSFGGVMLKSNVIFSSLDRATRRLFLSILNDLAKDNDNFINDLVRHEFLWKRAFEKLHVGEYENKYPFIYKACKDLRNKNYNTYYSKLEDLKDDQVKYINMLKCRPGEFARRLDYLLRNESFDVNYTLDIFKKVASKVSTNVLLSLWEFYKNRDLYPTRIFKINKERRVGYAEIEDTRNKLSKDIIDQVINIIEETLIDIYSTYEYKGKVYLDESIKNYALPRNNRNGSAQNKTLTFGTRIKLEPKEGDFLRFFTHFKNIHNDNYGGRVDIDLSLEFINEAMDDGFSLAWHNLDSGKDFDSYHSGDITSAPEGASEFVDLNYRKALKFARYVMVVNSVYTSQDFYEIPECFSGVMFMSERAKEGEIFNPEFIEHKYDLTQKGANINISFALDLKTLELIWIDSPIHYNGDVVAASSKSLFKSLKDALKVHMNLYDFMLLHKGHVEFTNDKEEADIVVSDSNDATLRPFDIAKIAAEWL